MRTPVLPVLAAASLAALLPAQSTKVAPIDHQNPTGPPPALPGSTSTSQFPLSAGVARVQYLYETSDSGRTLLDIPNGASITHVGFPRDEGSPSFGQQLRLQVFMGSGGNRTTATMGHEFAKNFARPPIEVFTLKTFALPNLGDLTSPPVVDEVMIPLDTPYTFDRSEPLLVEFRVHANSNGNRSFSYRLDVATDRSPVASFGQACRTSAGTLPALASSPTAIGGTWSLTLTNAPASTSVFVNLGLGRLAAGVPIPGAPGCTVDVAPLTVMAGMTNTGGSEYWSTPVPNDIRLWRASLFTQALAIDFFANPTGVVSSNGDEVTFGLDPRIAILFAMGDVQATSGSMIRSFGQITLFRHN